MKKKISILGITGSIGSSALKVCKNFPDDIELVAVSTHKSIDSLLKIIKEFRPKYAVVADQAKMLSYFNDKKFFYEGVEIYSGKEGIEFICQDKENDIIINAISGKAGLFPSITIIENDIDLASANKESIVCAGSILNELCKNKKRNIIPIDSEHSAIFHLLKDRSKEQIECIYLTASGGPFFKLDKNHWHKITVQDALKHPTWKMGNKITIDSATMANKGLEIIEAHYLFNVDYERIKVLIHPQSLIHSMIETIDGELYAQLGPNDMALPIQNAIFYPEMKYNFYNRFNFKNYLALELYPVDYNKFKMPYLAIECGKKGNIYTAFYNFVNELFVALFLDGKISFIQIEEFTDRAIEFFDSSEVSKVTMSKENIKLVDKEAENVVNRIVKKECNIDVCSFIKDFNSTVWF